MVIIMIVSTELCIHTLPRIINTQHNTKISRENLLNIWIVFFANVIWEKGSLSIALIKNFNIKRSKNDANQKFTLFNSTRQAKEQNSKTRKEKLIRNFFAIIY